MQDEIMTCEGDILPGNLAVITTRQVMNGESEIRLVVRDDDGDWQFLPYLEEITETDAFVVGIQEIIDLDPTVTDALELPLDHKAWRADSNSKWQIWKIDE